MSIWTTSVQKSATDTVEALSEPPSGGRVKLWLLGVGLSLLPLRYGFVYVVTGRTRLWGSRGSALDLNGSAAVALGIAYLAVAAFIHFHWFWGLHPKLVRFSQLFKAITVLVFLGALGYMTCQIVL